MTTFQGTETYLIECSRENSAINVEDDDDTNGSWSNETDFVIKRGDKISVEMVCANIRGSGTAAPTIEFSGQNVVVNGETKSYCDTKVLLEVFFYMNNNNTYSVGLPLIHPNGGINGDGGALGSGFTNLVSPYNLNPRIPQNTVTNQIRNYREVNMGVGYVFPIYDGTWTSPPSPFFNSRIPASGNTPLPQRECYGIYQYQVENPPGVFTWSAPGVALPAPVVGRVSRVRIQPHEMSGQTTPLPDASNNLFTDYDNGVIKGRTGDLYQNNFYVGNHIYVNNNTTPDEADLQIDWVGQIKQIYGTAGLGTPVFNVRVLELELEDTNSGYLTNIPFECGDCAVYVGDTYIDDVGWRRPLFNIKPGSSQEGLMNYDNLDLHGVPIVAGKYEGNGYMRGDNAMFLYSRNTRKPQTGQNKDLNLFPSTVFDPTSFTVDAGDYGELEPTAQFGYRNANIVKECNNDPYIFMRNDHFGSGRRGMNNEKMPLAEPMTAFIYISLKELLQDVESVTAVINERLRETITGIGTTQQQTNKILLNSIENPDDYKPASNVIPYYNRVGFYDKDVTQVTAGQAQNTLMEQPVNCQYRNEITDIIPIKNGGTVKVQPANFTSGRDYLAQSYGKQYGGIPRGEDNPVKPSQAQLNNIKETTYLREIETSSQNRVNNAAPATTNGTTTDELAEVNFKGWANPIYGNMATSNLYKYLLGDRWANLPVDNCDQVNWTGGDGAIPRQVGKTIILNNKLEYEVLNFTFPQGDNDYTTPLNKFPTEEPISLICNKLHENQIIYTNIPFPNEDDGEKNWAEFAKCMRNYETYYNKSNKPPVGYKNQRKDVGNWIFDGDVGMTDDRTTAQLRTQDGSTSYPPPLTDPTHPYIPPPNWTQDPSSVPQPKYQSNRPFIYDWLNQPDVNAMLSTDPIFGTALGLPQPIVNPNPTPADADYRPQVYGTNRTLICPTTTSEIFAGISARSNLDQEEKFRLLKELGRLKMKSRFQKDFVKKAKNFQGNIIIETNPPFIIDPHDNGFQAANNPPDPDYKVDTTFMESLDLGFYPYTIQLGGGITKTFCALFVGTDYHPEKEKLSTINFGSMCWGNSIGISNSFYDNHAICPVNNDQVKRGEPLSTVVTTPGEWVKIGFQNTLGIESSVNYQAPPADANAYTQTAGIDPGIPKSEWDFTTNFPANPAYENPDVAGRYRLKLVLNEGYRWDEQTTIIWEQSSLLTAAAVTGYSFISADKPGWNAATTPAGGRFTGLFKNPLLSATNTWILTTGTGTTPINPPNPTTNASVPGVFQIQGLGQPGAFHNGEYDTDDGKYQQYAQAHLYVWKFPTTSAGDSIPVNLGLEQNKVNYVWTGATQPTFQYDGGRVQFTQLQEDNILNQKSIPYSDATTNPSASTGTKAGIVNTACEDAVFSRNNRIDDFQANAKTEPSRNTGVRAEISGIGIYKVWLCPENYEPPNNINLSSYWNNKDETFDENGDLIIDYWGLTKINRDRIIESCVEADENNWENSLFSRLGFQSHRELLPAYGKQENRFNPTTYNQTRPDKIPKGTKPLILCNAVDNSIDPALNTFYSLDPDLSGVNGIPMYSNGFLNDESIALQLENQQLTASAPPILSTSPFLLIESDICQTNYRSGRTQQNVLFYLMKNYQASSFIYGYGSSYTHTANQDRVLSLINTALRDPITGRLQKCSSNSTIIYKIQRDVTILPPQTDALGNPLNIQQPTSKTDQLLEQIVQNTESNKSKGGGALGSGIGGGGASGGGSSGGGALQGIQRLLISSAEANAGATLNIVDGAQETQALEQMFADINANDDLTEEQKFEYSWLGGVIQRLLVNYPVYLLNDEAGIGGVIPATGDRNPLTADEASRQNASQRLTEYLAEELTRMGGLEAIRTLAESQGFEQTNENVDDLINLLGRVVINPTTGRPIQQGETMTTAGATAYFDFNTAGTSQGLLRITQLFDDFLNARSIPDGGESKRSIDEDYPDRESLQIAALDGVQAVLSNMLGSGRVNIADYDGNQLNPHPLGESTRLSVPATAEMGTYNSTSRDFNRGERKEADRFAERVARTRDGGETDRQEPRGGESKTSRPQPLKGEETDEQEPRK